MSSLQIATCFSLNPLDVLMFVFLPFVAAEKSLFRAIRAVQDHRPRGGRKDLLRGLGSVAKNWAWCFWGFWCVVPSVMIFWWLGTFVLGIIYGNIWVNHQAGNIYIYMGICGNKCSWNMIFPFSWESDSQLTSCHSFQRGRSTKQLWYSILHTDSHNGFWYSSIV